MTQFAVDPHALEATLATALGARALKITVALGEVSVVVAPEDYVAAAAILRDAPGCQFEILIDLCGVDYSSYKDQADSGGSWGGGRYAIVSHLLSVSLNQRVRLKVFAKDDDVPVVPSLQPIWSSVSWFEREAFDLFGIVFEGHDDLRRILTDYGFIGHPFRKDFPTTGHVEMRYDAEKKRVIYQPVTIEPREITPRIIREDHYGGTP
ncbi:MAG: NADH-quinone oxidoreductase subunit C [Rhodoferax sp.]